jgi:hypothetical protein
MGTSTDDGVLSGETIDETVKFYLLDSAGDPVKNGSKPSLLLYSRLGENSATYNTDVTWDTDDEAWYGTFTLSGLGEGTHTYKLGIVTTDTDVPPADELETLTITVKKRGLLGLS